MKRGTKWPPPSGFTGKTGAYPNEIDLAVWREAFSDGNLALRLPDEVEVAGQLWSVIGLDEDHYGGKTGAETIAEGEKRYGPLPPTSYSTSRKDGSRIRLYRIPAGIKLRGVLKFSELNIGDVEIIQYHHRYMLCWPSIHDKTGWLYQWFDAHGVVMDGPPRVRGPGRVARRRGSRGFGSTSRTTTPNPARPRRPQPQSARRASSTSPTR